MSWSIDGSDIPVANLPGNIEDRSAIQSDSASQAPLLESCTDTPSCLPPSSAATSIVNSHFALNTSFLSAPDEGRSYETDSGILPSATNVASQSRTASIVARDGGAVLEIQNIMGQFDNDDMGVKAEDNGSKGLTIQVPFPGASIKYPPRKSSLEPLQTASDRLETKPLSSLVTDVSQISKTRVEVAAIDPNSSQDHGSLRTTRSSDDNIISHPPPGSASARKALPPEPESEPDFSFDFHRFLEQLRHRTADPVAKFLRSFLVEFGKKQWMAHEQGKIIGDFLAFIANKMALCEIWRGLSDVEFDNAKEGMEKLVMNRLYGQTFSPAIPLSASAPTAKNRQKILDRSLGRGRTGQHQEDIERDEILGQKVRIYGWVREEHLDILPIGDSGQRFLALAQKGMQFPTLFRSTVPTDVTTELLKINTYRAPRDKIICVLNCCKVIFGEFSTPENICY